MHILLWDQDCMVAQVFIVGKMLHEQMLYFTTVENGIYATFQNVKCAIVVKVPISWLGFLHIYKIWNLVIRIAIYLVV